VAEVCQPQCPQLRQLPARKEHVLPYPWRQGAAADVQALQLAASCEGTVHCCCRVDRYSRGAQAVAEYQARELLQLLQLIQQLFHTCCTIRHPHIPQLQVLQQGLACQGVWLKLPGCVTRAQLEACEVLCTCQRTGRDAAAAPARQSQVLQPRESCKVLQFSSGVSDAPPRG
jgi:hypothetical protein